MVYELKIAKDSKKKTEVWNHMNWPFCRRETTASIWTGNEKQWCLTGQWVVERLDDGRCAHNRSRSRKSGKYVAENICRSHKWTHSLTNEHHVAFPSPHQLQYLGN